MIFDTGATMTAIDEDIARRCGYKWHEGKDAAVDGIGGSKIPAKMITMPSLILDGYDIGPNCLYVLKFPESASTKAILGMNAIRNFKTIIDINSREDVGYTVDEPIGLITLIPKFDMDDKPTIDNFIPNISRFGIWSMSNSIPKTQNSQY